MAPSCVYPTDFLRQGSEIEVRFVDGEDTTWYKGVVQQLYPDKLQDATYGHFVTCEVLYDDGDLLHTELYDKDFNVDGSLDAWRFSCNEWNVLLKVLGDEHQQMQRLLGVEEQSTLARGVIEEEEESEDGYYEETTVSRSGKRTWLLMIAVVIVSCAMSTAMLSWHDVQTLMPNSWKEVSATIASFAQS